METLWIPGQLPGLNDILLKTKQRRGKGTAYSAMKAALTDEIQHLAVSQGFLPVKGPAWFTYLHMEGARNRDPSNFASAAQKVIEDGLQGSRKIPTWHRPYISGDGWKYVSGFIHYWNLSPEPGVFVIVHPDHIFSHDDALTIFRGRENKA